MIDAPTIRNPSMSCTLSFGSIAASESLTYLAAADRVIDRIDTATQPRADVVVAAHALGEHILLLQRAQRRRFQKTPHSLETRDHGFGIIGLAEEIRSITRAASGSALPIVTVRLLLSATIQSSARSRPPRCAGAFDGMIHDVASGVFGGFRGRYGGGRAFVFGSARPSGQADLVG